LNYQLRAGLRIVYFLHFWENEPKRNRVPVSAKHKKASPKCGLSLVGARSFEDRSHNWRRLLLLLKKHAVFPGCLSGSPNPTVF
jgi:hypothetical protein